MRRLLYWRWFLARLRRGSSESVLDHVIPPEIKDDQLYKAIARVASRENVRQMLEIGSSSGAGSTAAFVAGALANPTRPQLHCIEVSAPRYQALVKRHAAHDFVRCYQASSVDLEGFAKPDEVEQFYQTVNSKLRAFPLSQVLGWLEQDVQYVLRQQVTLNGIRMVKRERGIDYFDVVLIDGSEFTAAAELREVYGARFMLLDDIATFKNHGNFQTLVRDPGYRLVEKGDEPRNGYALFERAAAELPARSAGSAQASCGGSATA